MADVVVSFGGSLSGEHGDGQSRAELLPKMYGDDLVRAFGEFKAIWDPANKMNPGKVVDPYRLDENLRYGTEYSPLGVSTHFDYPDDRHDFAYVTQRCVGVGACRKTNEGVKCPSYMATMEEMHSTRGRAHLLFEMMIGDPLGKDDGALWRNEHVKESLDLCLACKACKHECPMQVDMATYKAEFLAHHYEGRLRPRHAYAFGMIDVWARVASLAPSVANFFAQTRPFSSVAKWIVGAAPQRSLPRFASSTFRRCFHRSGARPVRARGNGRTSDDAPLLSVHDDPHMPQVVLWVDTFDDHFHPEICGAAVEVLEAAGFSPAIARAPLCCGRPLYDFGMLDRAKHYLHDILGALRSPIRLGVPVVALEPSCAAVFLDEMTNLLPHDVDAQRLRQQVFLLPDFLEKMRVNLPLRLEREAIVHGHCHQRALVGLDAERRLLERLGMHAEFPDAGCCGMAGAFGFERGEHYDVSMRVGERVLLPKVRSASDDALLVADGFSCREQIAQATNRRPLHVAQLLSMALRDGPEGAKSGEAARSSDARSPLERARTVIALALVVLFLVLVVWLVALPSS